MRMPYSRPTQSADSCGGLYQQPVARNIAFVAGDEFEDGPFTFPGRVWTPERPEDDAGNPMYHESETVPDDVTASLIELVAPWEQRFWFADIRSSFLSTIRYHNGWVPWYGTRPSRVWWSQMSLGAWFTVTAEYDHELECTYVVATLPTGQSVKLNPGGVYRWSLESARPRDPNAEGTAMHFDKVKTWIKGTCTVGADWTLTPVIRPIGLSPGMSY